MTDNVVIRLLDPEQYYLLEEFCEKEGIPMLSPDWSKVVAAIDMETEKVIGIVVCQMQLHMEPVWIQREYQGKGVWELMADAMEGYLKFLAWTTGETISVWNQPTNPAAVRICRMRGYVESERSLWYKQYDGKELERSLELWQQQLDQQSESDLPS
jgi:hypothetical protein